MAQRTMRLRRVYGWLATFVVAFAVVAPQPASASGPEAGPTPLAQAHAHNDYEHPRPLLDALDHGFTSVEADVWLVDGKLLVAHDRDQVKPDRTLESLYLQPLLDRVRANNGSVYAGWPHTVHLLIDVKSDATPTYQAIDAVLRRYQDMLTQFTPHEVHGGAITVTISGNRDLPLMASQPIRHAAYDGRLTDLGSSARADLIPLISDNWTKTFTWQGVGPMPAAERDNLRRIVATAHAHGQRVRFWATPDMPGPARDNVWREELDAGVDFFNTDHLADLQQFLLTNSRTPSTPAVEWWPPRQDDRDAA